MAFVHTRTRVMLARCFCLAALIAAAIFRLAFGIFGVLATVMRHRASPSTDPPARTGPRQNVLWSARLADQGFQAVKHGLPGPLSTSEPSR